MNPQHPQYDEHMKETGTAIIHGEVEFSTDAECQKAMDIIDERLANGPTPAEVLFHHCFELSFPTRREVRAGAVR